MNTTSRKIANSSSNAGSYLFERTGHCISGFKKMHNLQQSGSFCDVTVTVGEEEYLAHTVVLAVISPYFAELLQHEDRTEANQVVEIDLRTTSPLSFQAVLDYIYSGKISITTENIKDLILAGHILQIDSLGAACGNAMSVLLSPANWVILKTVAGASSISECEVFNSKTNKWHAIASMRNKRRYHAVIGFEHLYAFGGRDGQGILSSTEYYDPVKNAWTLTTAMPHERYSHAICSLNGAVFICGGRNKNDEILSTVEQFDVSTARYKTCAAMNAARADFKMAAAGGRIYAVGGLNGRSLDSVERFDPREGRWSPAPSMKTKRRSHGLTVLNDYIYCTGGNGAGKNRGERFDTRTNVWSAIPEMLNERRDHELVTLDGCIYAIGGLQLNSVEKFDPDTNQWLEMPSMLKERWRLGASVLDCLEIKPHNNFFLNFI